jgi:hypothetical protein
LITENKIENIKNIPKIINENTPEHIQSLELHISYLQQQLNTHSRYEIMYRKEMERIKLDANNEIEKLKCELKEIDEQHGIQHGVRIK